MLSPSNITFITIFGGLIVAVILILGRGFFRRKWPKSPEACAGVFANSMTLGTIGSFLYNTGYVVVHKSFGSGGIKAVYPVSQAGLGIGGNEATAFFAFLYAGGMIVIGIYRNLK